MESVSPKELTEAKPIKRAAVSKKQTKSKPLPTTQPDKIPEVTYPVSLGYEVSVNDSSTQDNPKVY